MVDHACTKLLRSQSSGGSEFEASSHKIFKRLHLNRDNARHAGILSHHRYPGNVNRRIMVQADPGINVRPYLKINQCKKIWGHGSTGRVLPGKNRSLSSNPIITKFFLVLKLLIFQDP
jgi:hypothetical protein